ncbi:GNAT family N-acetyltransferase [Candidatus Woesearchaeota archaeon]|nr:GNAT family N-acetyltransferase [Candidatus Woesearchaeota archaeon]
MRLETLRLILRDWKKTDVQDLVKGLNNLSISKWLPFVPHPYTQKDAEQWVSSCMENTKTRKERSSYKFAIELKSEKKVIGGVSLDNINQFQGTAGGGIWINAKYHGHGYGAEAFGERIRFAFEELKLRRLDNGFLKGNPSSWKMQQRLGYKLEGMRRQAFKCMADGKIKDEYLTGLLREEWKKG